jgi:putative copper export protein
MNSLMTFMSSLYQYMKAVHLVAAFAWVAGLFYLPRIFAYHAQIGASTPQAEHSRQWNAGFSTGHEPVNGGDHRFRRLDDHLPE